MRWRFNARGLTITVAESITGGLISKMITDVSGSSTILKESFLHYNDGALSFLKNGAILDLDSINGKDAVKFYNITNKSIIEKRSKGYVIETDGDDIKLNNFIGRISDNKYIVVRRGKKKYYLVKFK